MFTSRAYSEVFELHGWYEMHNHGFRRILDNILLGKRTDLQSIESHNRTVNQLKAASAASFEPQRQGPSRFSANGGYVVEATKLHNETAADACAGGSKPAASTGMTLQQLQQALKNRPPRADINRLRRKFALANHPDRACETHRKTLSVRLSVANNLIDEALKNTRR